MSSCLYFKVNVNINRIKINKTGSKMEKVMAIGLIPLTAKYVQTISKGNEIAQMGVNGMIMDFTQVTIFCERQTVHRTRIEQSSI